VFVGSVKVVVVTVPLGFALVYLLLTPCGVIAAIAVGCVCRFSGGGGGVYCGVKDLHLSEVSGAFSIALESVPAAGAAAAAAGGGSAQREVRLKVTLAGIATGTSSQE
jgi:hypothetical protein